MTLRNVLGGGRRGAAHAFEQFVAAQFLQHGARVAVIDRRHAVRQIAGVDQRIGLGFGHIGLSRAKIGRSNLSQHVPGCNNLAHVGMDRLNPTSKRRRHALCSLFIPHQFGWQFNVQGCGRCDNLGL